MRDLGNMADCRCVQVFMFCVFTQIFLLCVAQNTHMKNVAQYRTCGTSSLYASTNNCSAALNGNTSTNYQTNPPNCIHTMVNDTSPFWWVDLREKVTISVITIYGRTGFLDRMRCVNVSVDGALVKRFTDVSGWTNDKYTIPVLRGGRVVNITKDCDSNSTINICEVQVWVCDDGWYDNCSKSCGQCDNNTSCDKVNGNCASCQTGFSPPLCQECADGYYQTDCSQTCGNCGSNSVCDKTTGTCTSCQTRFTLPYCKECIDRWYGTDCSQTCGNCGNNSVCNKTTGWCTSCQTRFNLPYCKECSAGYYGKNCNESCGHCADNTTCDPNNGTCSSGCSEGYREGLCNECDARYYGENCSQLCGHCRQDATCDPVNGTCLDGCSLGFKPGLCTECDARYYGTNCDQTCGYCLVNTTCDPGNGTCPSGCSDGYRGSLCKEAMTSSPTGSNNVLVGAIVGPVLAVIVAAVVVVIVFVWLRRRRQPEGKLSGLSRRKEEGTKNEVTPSETTINLSARKGTSRSTSRPDETVDTTPDYTNIGYTTNVYDSLKAPDDNTTAYTSLNFHTDVHR